MATDATRRADRSTGVLVAAGAALTGCAGAVGSDPAGPTTARSIAGLDLREANVTAVAVEATEDGHRFAVTRYHDDGEDGYADWWYVERRDGMRLGRRELAHPHGTREFTRSTTIAIPDDVECVVVRGTTEPTATAAGRCS